MAYSMELATLVAEQLQRFSTLSGYYFAGQAVNFEFWIEQVLHAFAAIDGYGVRLVRMEGAQERYAAMHGPTNFIIGADMQSRPNDRPPRRLPQHEMRRARRTLKEAAMKFLDRCSEDGFLSSTEYAATVAKLNRSESN